MTSRTMQRNGLTVVLMDSISYIAPEHAGAAVVSGSHGGLSSARYALKHPPLLVVFHDAGVGKDRAGVAGLDLLQEFGIGAVTVSAASARIGDAEDTLEHGTLSHANHAAASLGAAPGQLVKDLLELLVARAKGADE